MDAMVHALEAFVVPVFHPMCDAIALEAIRIVWNYLPRAYENGSDIEARGMMQIALHYIGGGGLFSNTPSLMGITNASTNSYRRFGSGCT